MATSNGSATKSPHEPMRPPHFESLIWRGIFQKQAPHRSDPPGDCVPAPETCPRLVLCSRGSRSALGRVRWESLWMPYVAVQSSDGGQRTLRTGVRFAAGPDREVGLQVARREGGLAGPDHAARWQRRSGVIVTFPAGRASNGLSGDRVISIARKWFTVHCATVKSRFSTLAATPGIDQRGSEPKNSS